MGFLKSTRFHFAVLAIFVLSLAGFVGVGSLAAAPGTPAQAYLPWESPRLFAFPGDWMAASAVTVRTVYPAQASWQWVTSTEHLGSASVQAGTACAACHGNPAVGASTVGGWAGPPADHQQSVGCQACHGVVQQRVESLGEKLVADPWLEDDPIEGKRPYVHVKVQAAYDSEYLYLRFEWESERPGISHDLLRWNGEKWETWGGPKPDAPKEGVMPSYEDRLTINVADRDLRAYDGAQVGWGQAGCWITCHSSMRAMSNEPSSAELRADPRVGSTGLKWSDIRKYLLTTRTGLDDAGGWNKLKPVEEIASLLNEGAFVDMLMWRAARAGPAGYADDSYVLEYRNADKGKSMFAENALKEGMPTYMYDEAKVGFRAIPEDRFEELLPLFPLIEGKTAVPFDRTAQFQVGDIISRQLVRTPDGSRGEILANSRWENGRWVLEMRRSLNTGNPDDVAFEPGSVYAIGIAIFDDMVSNRRHQVSFPVTLGLGVPADIVAVPVGDRMAGR